MVIVILSFSSWWLASSSSFQSFWLGNVAETVTFHSRSNSAAMRWAALWPASSLSRHRMTSSSWGCVSNSWWMGLRSAAHEWGDFRITPFRQKSNGVEHVALTKGEWTEDEPVLIRVHSSCATGDIFGSYRCDCGEQLHRAMQMIQKEGKGAIVYLNQEGRGIGLCNKIHAYKLRGRRG